MVSFRFFFTKFFLVIGTSLVLGKPQGFLSEFSDDWMKWPGQCVSTGTGGAKDIISLADGLIDGAFVSSRTRVAQGVMPAMGNLIPGSGQQKSNKSPKDNQ